MIAVPDRAKGSALGELKAHLFQHLGERFSIDELASFIERAPRTFQRDFADSLGLTAGAFMRETNLALAAGLLVWSERAIMDVGFECGYETLQGFHKAFRSVYGLTPGEFRHKFSVVGSKTSSDAPDRQALASTALIIHGDFGPVTLMYSASSTISIEDLKPYTYCDSESGLERQYERPWWK